MPQRLTLKQKMFAQEYVKNGGNGTQAALKVYNTEDYSTAAATASGNLKKDNIQEEVDRLSSKMGLTLDKNLENLSNIANSKLKEYSGDVILKANVEFLKLRGAYPGTKNTQVSLSIHANVKDLKYQDLKKEIEVIEGEMADLGMDNLSTSEDETTL